ncbi:uncharacterized protein LOC124149141 [Haliotis rufescens]|uniref:uncharacterized protein LOC124149141 n=1 Tax=Haliotis rufescens TaxID=6454 RepID=UPI00201F1D6F|nr:uncharacterized protein LOC124149141 [Haliotis rufescens]XP_046376473.2 uncharacterized protein LOC124149141 [Haliotis rufescens]
MTSGVQKSNQRSVERGAVLVQRLTGYHGDGKDVTNPRELYTILSQAETKRNKAGTNIPLLVTESTLQQKVNHEMNIRVKGYRPEKRPESPPFHHQSSLELFDSAELPTLTLVRQSSSLEDLTTLKRREKIRTTYASTNISENLPSLKNEYPKVAFEEDVIQFENKGDNSGIVLPKIPKVLEKTLPLAQAAGSPIPQELDIEASVDHRLAGVPPELVGRARQILMEETYREQLRARGLGLSRTRNLFPKESGKSNDLKAYDMYPAQYWELRAETVQQPQDLELDMIDRDYYRMKQKSVLKLKVMDRESRARGERSPSDTSSPPTQRETHRTLPRLFHPKPRHNHMDSFEDETVGLSPFTNLMLGPVVAEAAGTCHQDTDSLAGPPNSRKTNRHMFPYLMSQDPMPASVTRFPKYTQVVSTPRPKYMPPTSVVNLTIDQPTPRRRRPRHIEQNLEKQKHCARIGESTPCGKGNVLIGKDEAVPGTDTSRSATVDDVIQEAPEPVSQEVEEPFDDPKSKISLLTGFKTLEVFGEAKNEPTERTQKIITKASVPSRYRPQCHPPLYKLDMKNYPPQGNMIQALFALEEHQAGPETDNNPISLRVIDGDAILSKVQTNGDPQTSRTVKSEGTVEQTSMRDTPVLSRS